MKKVFAFTLICLLAIGSGLVAQQQPAATETPARSYMAVGFHIPFNYYIKAEDGSMERYGITFKAPINKIFGVQFSINQLIIPIKEYELNAVSRSGNGEEEYTNIQIGFLYFMPFEKYMQAKVGVDYLKFQNGYIAANPAATAADPNCGTVYTHCVNCAHDLYGVFLGINLDVPIYERLLILSGLSYHWILNDHPSTKNGFVNLNLGLGYKI